jgi:predicted site-specific integrase-resolvase
VHAANAAGISITTLQRWVEMGRNGVEPYVQLRRGRRPRARRRRLRNQAIISAAA